jgi:hypothetical protein
MYTSCSFAVSTRSRFTLNCINVARWRGIPSGHRARLHNRKSRVRIPPGRKVFRSMYIPIYITVCCCKNFTWIVFGFTYLIKINALQKNCIRKSRLAQNSVRFEPPFQGLPDGIFSNQNSNFHIFWRALDWKMLVYVFYGHTFGIFYSHFVYFMAFW